MTYKIGIIGQGFVGSAIREGLKNFYDIRTYDLDPKKDKWFGELEKFYEYNNIHSLDHTKKIYSQEFNEDLEEIYEIQDIIGSGSIGQVYKMKHKRTDELYAIKIIHPNMDGQILFLKYISSILFIVSK